MKNVLLAAALAVAGVAHADYKVEMKSIDAKGAGKSLGTVTISANPGGGVVLKPALKGLPPGDHGFHVHEKGDCGPKAKDGKPTAGEAAGPHWDPDKAGKHGSPSGGGHRGDLPVLQVAADGTAKRPVTAPRVKLADLRNKSLMIHEGGDNFSDKPKPLGGGGKRIACGVIEPRR